MRFQLREAPPDGAWLSSLLVTKKLCLTHSELSEALEGHRKGLMDDKLTHQPMLEVELADAVIRIADLAGDACSIIQLLYANYQRNQKMKELAVGLVVLSLFIGGYLAFDMLASNDECNKAMIAQAESIRFGENSEKYKRAEAAKAAICKVTEVKAKTILNQ